MTDWRDDKWEQRAERGYSEITAHPVKTGFKWFAGIALVLVGLSLLGGLIFGLGSWISSWGEEAKRVTSPTNVREQNTEIIQAWEDMKAAASNACSAEKAQKESGDPLIIEDPSLAYDAIYRRHSVEYNRRMDNLFEAQAVRNLPLPSNLRSYPRDAPTLEQAKADLKARGLC